MLTHLKCPISRLRGGMGLHYSDNTISKLDVMAQKA